MFFAVPISKGYMKFEDLSRSSYTLGEIWDMNELIMCNNENEHLMYESSKTKT